MSRQELHHLAVDLLFLLDLPIVVLQSLQHRVLPTCVILVFS